MLKKNKGYMVILIAVVLSALLFSGCGAEQDNSLRVQTSVYTAESTGQTVGNAGQQDSTDPTMESTKQHLLTVWSDYLDVMEKMYASEMWTLHYVDTFLESGDWNDLVRARTACIASARYLTELSMKEEDLTEEEYLTLAKAGIDTSYQTVDFSSVPFFVEEAHNIIRNQLLEGMEQNIYYENSIDILRDQVLAERDSISIMCQYLCIESNYLLLSLGDDTISKPYWSSMKENYPVLSSGQEEWCAAEAELEAAADTCMDKYEEIVIQQSELVSKAEADLYQMTQIIKNEELDTLLASFHTMTNVPYLLPSPVWYNPHTFGYLSVIIGEDGSVAYPESGDELGDARYGVYMKAENVTEEEIVDYLDTAKNYAIDISEDTGSWYIYMPDYIVKIDCEDDMTTILFSGEDVTFAPVWYILQ